MNRNTKGIVGLLAIAAGALGIYKYNKLSPEEKAALKAKARKAGDTLKETYNDVEDQVSEKLTDLKNALDKELSKAQYKNSSRAVHPDKVEDATIIESKEALDKGETTFV